MDYNQFTNSCNESRDLGIPLLQDFYLNVKKISFPNNRNIPLIMNDYGKVSKTYLLQKKDTFFQIYSLGWGNDILVRTLYLHHFIEVLLAYVHNDLSLHGEYVILNVSNQFGIRITIDSKSKILNIENFDYLKNIFTPLTSINKIECRILIRMFFNYLNKGEISESEDDFDGNTKCNYSNNRFYLKVLE